ncbi:MAG: LD-carboxypeptidase, partial [Pseudomonadota bacterium]|nr:LD-carboxypeptidase [Pseudomonadota bacterium]
YHQHDGRLASRRQELCDALTQMGQVIICARGGYGVSDLLPFLPYRELSPSLLVGYSDISALLSALWTQRQFIGVHGAMPATNSWEYDKSEAMTALLTVLAGKDTTGKIKLQRLGEHTTIHGTLFGGCLSVLTNLIATPYLPQSLAGYILFFEDINENVGRVLRNFNQWQQSGMLAGVKAIILGRFEKLAGDAQWLYRELLERLACPLYFTDCFGHSAPLYPLPVGGKAEITGDCLTWKLTSPFTS